MNGNFNLSWHKGQVAQYAEIELEITSTETEIYGVIMPDYTTPLFANAIQFGVNIFATTHRHKIPDLDKLSIVVLNLRAIPCDTNVWSLAYATFQSMCNAFNINGNHIFYFNQESGKFTLSLPSL